MTALQLFQQQETHLVNPTEMEEHNTEINHSLSPLSVQMSVINKHLP